ncbi:class I SAM-dependent methyltransferase [Winogradskyella alexanderae]|uniref:Class I SAM-dependent methyltransferase n=1 Tax=Winogradskyella alexanderae TaxID=2877123 RepID=A0ABS7XTY7_9FLAO|nr:class I SAM-dependent methyltransferase [Winogradskyella alexanderae]MCA0132849.1 class I SAM-dependent methyltransferase [Winogradskyella alexanderae]
MYKDVFGKALLDYHNDNYTEDIITWTNISDKDMLPLPYLFRNFEEMPMIEQEALKHSNGKILDVGCGTGNHSLWLQNKGFEVKAIDISMGAVSVAKSRGVNIVEQKHLLEETETYDTILLLMNGTGIFEELTKLNQYLEHLKSLLTKKGKILIDSSDIRYMYEDEEGSYWIDLNQNYYGELDYYISYKGEIETPMKWLYLDFDTLKTACQTVGFKCYKIIDGPHFDYLAQLKLF